MLHSANTTAIKQYDDQLSVRLEYASYSDKFRFWCRIHNGQPRRGLQIAITISKIFRGQRFCICVRYYCEPYKDAENIKMQITIQKGESSSSGQLVLDGVVIPNSWGHECGTKVEGGVRTKHVSYCPLTECPLIELALHLESLNLPYMPTWCDHISSFLVTFTSVDEGPSTIMLIFDFEPEGWAAPWSIHQYCTEVMAAVDESGYEGLQYFKDQQYFSEDFGLTCTVTNWHGSLQDELNYWAARLTPLMEEVHSRLSFKAGQNTLVNIFEFPPDVETACQQYLVYFGQFLADLGIEASIGLSREARRILFSVTPADPNQALQTLRDALQVYLQLPNDAELRQQLQASSEIAALQLSSNVLHLQSQLQLYAAVLEAKNQTIEALRVENYLLKQVPTSTLPPCTPIPAKSDAEPLIPNLVSVKDVEIKGVVIHLPELMRRLKRRFGPR